jgi:hypothetical protein
VSSASGKTDQSVICTEKWWPCGGTRATPPPQTGIAHHLPAPQQGVPDELARAHGDGRLVRHDACLSNHSLSARRAGAGAGAGAGAEAAIAPLSPLRRATGLRRQGGRAAGEAGDIKHKCISDGGFRGGNDSSS